MATCSTDVVGESRTLPFAHRAIHSDRVGTHQGDAPKRVENTRVPARKGAFRIAPGEAGEDMALPVFSTIILGIAHRETVEEDFHQ